MSSYLSSEVNWSCARVLPVEGQEETRTITIYCDCGAPHIIGVASVSYATTRLEFMCPFVAAHFEIAMDSEDTFVYRVKDNPELRGHPAR